MLFFLKKNVLLLLFYYLFKNYIFILFRINVFRRIKSKIFTTQNNPRIEHVIRQNDSGHNEEHKTAACTRTTITEECAMTLIRVALMRAVTLARATRRANHRTICRGTGFRGRWFPNVSILPPSLHTKDYAVGI